MAEALLEQYSVWYSPKVEPWQDREGILLDACNLVRAAGGDENCVTAQVASHLFSALSPHLGCTARGTGPLSSAAEMKALLKYWRLPQTGKKDELQARIREEVCPAAAAAATTTGGGTGGGGTFCLSACAFKC